MADFKKLTEQQFDLAQQFINQHARPLEQALFKHHFEQAAHEDVLNVLSIFQNDDGGFGNALEPDFRLPDSSPMATSVAIQIFRDINAPEDHPMVQKAVDYLLANYSDSLSRWEPVPPQISEYPRAPWWGAPEEPAPGFQPNVSAELIGHFHHYDSTVPASTLRTWTDNAIEHLETMIAPSEMHDLLCYLWLEKSLPDSDKFLIQRALLDSGQKVVTRDPEQWSSYCVKPLWLAPNPKALLAESLHEDIHANLDYEIDHQGEDGAWCPFWNWGEAFPEDWAKAEREWKGILTMNVLKSLKAYQRLEA
jgi:hypothetical protein